MVLGAFLPGPAGDTPRGPDPPGGTTDTPEYQRAHSSGSRFFRREGSTKDTRNYQKAHIFGVQVTERLPCGPWRLVYFTNTRPIMV